MVKVIPHPATTFNIKENEDDYSTDGIHLSVDVSCLLIIDSFIFINSVKLTFTCSHCQVVKVRQCFYIFCCEGKFVRKGWSQHLESVQNDSNECLNKELGILRIIPSSVIPRVWNVCDLAILSEGRHWLFEGRYLTLQIQVDEGWWFTLDLLVDKAYFKEVW